MVLSVRMLMSQLTDESVNTVGVPELRCLIQINVTLFYFNLVHVFLPFFFFDYNLLLSFSYICFSVLQI